MAELRLPALAHHLFQIHECLFHVRVLSRLFLVVRGRDGGELPPLPSARPDSPPLWRIEWVETMIAHPAFPKTALAMTLFAVRDPMLPEEEAH